MLDRLIFYLTKRYYLNWNAVNGTSFIMMNSQSRKIYNKADLRDLIAATGLVISNWIQIVDFPPMWPLYLMDDLKKQQQQGTCSIPRQTLWIISNPTMNLNWSYSPDTLNSGRNWWYFVLCDLEIWWMTLKNNRAPLLYYIKLCASFHSHWWSQTGVTVPKRSIRVKISNIFSRVTLTFDGWPRKSIGHLFHPASSFVHHFIAVCEFKLELRSGNG